MATQITDIIGKRAPGGHYEREPVEPKELRPALAAVVQGDHLATLRVRPAEALASMPDDMRHMARRQLVEIREQGQVTVTVDRRQPDSVTRLLVPVRETYPADRPFRVSVRRALRLLQTHPYLYIFEEVDDGRPSPVRAATSGRPPSPAEAGQVAALEARLAQQDAQLARLTALLEQTLAAGAAAPAPSAPPAESPDEDDDASDDDTTTDSPARPPRPRRR